MKATHLAPIRTKCALQNENNATEMQQSEIEIMHENKHFASNIATRKQNVASLTRDPYSETDNENLPVRPRCYPTR